jgi:hypothetical protein
MPIMVLVCLRLGYFMGVQSNQFVVVSFNLQTHQESGLFLLLVGFFLLVGYSSLGSVSTLTKNE